MKKRKGNQIKTKRKKFNRKSGRLKMTINKKRKLSIH